MTCPNSKHLQITNLPITRRQILGNSKLKKFADNIFKFDETGRKLSKQLENTVGKGEIARYEQFLLFPQCFQRLVSQGHQKVSLCGNGLTHYHTKPHFDALKICSCGKRSVTSNLSFPQNVFYPTWHLFFQFSMHFKMPSAICFNLDLAFFLIVLGTCPKTGKLSFFLQLGIIFFMILDTESSPCISAFSPFPTMFSTFFQPDGVDPISDCQRYLSLF